MAIAACFIFFLPLLTEAKHSPFAMHWANQSLLRAFLHFAAMFFMAIPILGWGIGIVLNFVAFAFLVISIIWAVQGQAKQLPIIGKYTLLKPS